MTAMSYEMSDFNIFPLRLYTQLATVLYVPVRWTLGLFYALFKLVTSGYLAGLFSTL